MIDWPKATAHYAASSVFSRYGEKTRSSHFCENEHREVHTADRTGLVGAVSELTQESYLMTYAIFSQEIKLAA